MRFQRVRIVLPALALAVAALPFPAVGAHEFEAGSEVSIRYGGGAFKGSVSSGRARCERGRRVILMKRRSDRPAKKVGSDRTNGNGKYRIDKDSPNGRYFVKVARKLSTPYGHRHDCDGTRSETIRI